MPIDPEAEERVSILNGERGDAAQLESMISRGNELIDRAFAFLTVMGVDRVTVFPGDEPLITND
jgi:hypothetical protein